jgi:hypothetical protein
VTVAEEDRFRQHRDGLVRDVLDAAEGYAGRGWPVVPLWWPGRGGSCACGRPDCDSAGKHPLVRRGLYSATTDPTWLQRWWARWPNANVGVRTGSPAGIMVVDVDGERGMESLRALGQAHGGLRAGWAQTGSGGWHAYLQLQAGQRVPNSVGRLGPGLDVRGEGGFVVAPPSLHRSGHRYRWRQPPGELPQAPAWLIELSLPPPAPPARPLTLRAQEVTDRYVAAATNRETAAAASAPAGTRNYRLYLAAYRLGRLVGGGLADEGTVTHALMSAGLSAGLPQHECVTAIRNGLRRGRERPRQPEQQPSPAPAARPPSGPRP